MPRANTHTTPSHEDDTKPYPKTSPTKPFPTKPAAGSGTGGKTSLPKEVIRQLMISACASMTPDARRAIAEKYDIPVKKVNDTWTKTLVKKIPDLVANNF